MSDPEHPSPDDPSADEAHTQGTLCPYCGGISSNRHACDHCQGLFEPLSRQASQNGMGPWFVRDEANPFLPGCAYATLRSRIARGRINLRTVIRGPTTRQFWTYAGSIPGVAHLLGECHACHHPCRPDQELCASCAASFLVSDERQVLGLSLVRLLPGQAPAKTVAASAMAPIADAPVTIPVGDQSYPVTPPIDPMPGAQPAAPSAHDAVFAAHSARREREARRSARILIILLIIGLGLIGLFLMVLAARPTQPALQTQASPAAGPGPPPSAP